jgi:hypothetical protein
MNQKWRAEHFDAPPPNESGTSDAFATALAFATVLALATVIVAAAFATALALATVQTFAVMFAGVAARRVRAGSVGAGILRPGDNAGHQSRDGRSDQECSLCSAHNVFFCLVYENRRSIDLHLPPIFGD